MKKILYLTALTILSCILLTGCTCKHENKKVINDVAATCTLPGYSGDIYCDDCKKTIEKGEEIPAIGHNPGNPINVIIATCTSEGYTGDILCTICGEMLTPGQKTAMLPHTPSEGRNGAIDATCNNYGYTGDITCQLCGAIIEKGDSIEKLPHTPGELVRVKEATCTREGYTGDIYCVVCNDLIKKGTSISLKPHEFGDYLGVEKATCLKPGYTGNRKCNVCGTIEYGHDIPIVPHDFDENNVCKVCNWRVPGLYINDKLEFTWQQLIDAQYISVSGNTLNSVAGTLYGTLVISEDITQLKNYMSGMFTKGGPDEYYIPRTIKKISDGAFYGKGLSHIRFFGEIEEIGKSAFESCSNLREFEYPEGLKRLGSYAFSGSALTRVTLSETILNSWTSIDCFNIEYINEWPRNLKSIGLNWCKFKEIILPNTVEQIGIGYTMNLVKGAKYLQKLDISQTKVNGILIENCPKLEKMLLPEQATWFEIEGENRIKLLYLPDNIKSLKFSVYNSETQLESIIWPTALTKVKGIENLKKLKTIYFRGSELMWDLSGGKSIVPSNVKVIYDCSDDFINELLIKYKLK